MTHKKVGEYTNLAAFCNKLFEIIQGQINNLEVHEVYFVKQKVSKILDLF